MDPSQTTQKALRGRFIKALAEKSIAIQNMREQGYFRAAKDDNGSKKVVDLKKYISLLFYYCPDKCQSSIVVSVRQRNSVCSYYCTLPGPGALLRSWMGLMDEVWLEGIV